MKLLNRDSDYALRALLAMAARPRQDVTPVSELTERLGLPRPYLRKIMQTLARNGIVVSRKGQRGGFVLGRRPDGIRLADVVRTFQGDMAFRDCLFRKNVCRDLETCPLRKMLGRLENRFLKELEAVSIASLLRERARPRKRGGACRGRGDGRRAATPSKTDGKERRKS
jgi:Rrf2 family protein